MIMLALLEQISLLAETVVGTEEVFKSQKCNNKMIHLYFPPEPYYFFVAPVYFILIKIFVWKFSVSNNCYDAHMQCTYVCISHKTIKTYRPTEIKQFKNSDRYKTGNMYCSFWESTPHNHHTVHMNVGGVMDFYDFDELPQHTYVVHQNINSNEVNMAI